MVTEVPAVTSEQLLQFGTYLNRNAVCEVQPTLQDEFVFVTVFANGQAVGMPRGIRRDAASVAAMACGFSFNGASFTPKLFPPQHRNPIFCQPQTKRDCTVYFIRGVDGGPIKIGRAICIESRLASLQSCSPIQLHVLAVIHGASPKIEKQLHRRFAKHRLHGEWFSPCDELLALIESHGGQP